MPHRHFPHNLPPITDSVAVNRFADCLSVVKRADGLTDANLGEVLGRGMDQARLYRLGDSEIGMVGFLRAVRQWGDDMNPVLALAGYRLARADRADTCDVVKGVTLSAALHRVLDAVRDGTICADELAGMADEIRDAGAVMDELRDRLARRAA